jgi:hypothetical protein
MQQLRPNSRRVQKPGSVHDKVRGILSDHVGYVLVTCRPTKQAGRMEVELSYEGDPDLASYLVEGAQGYFENEEAVGCE